MIAENLSRSKPAPVPGEQGPASLGWLLGRAVQDFNSMLSAIHGYSGLMMTRLPSGDPCRGYAEGIQAESRQAAMLCRQLLAFGRGRTLRPEKLDLGEVVSESRHLLRCILGDEIRLVIQLDPSWGTVRADRALIQQVLVNLASNARDAMPAGGEFAIGTRPEEGWIVLTVSDTGCGMDEETRRRAFEPFFTTKQVGKGMGLGLASVQDIVARHNGKIKVHSEPGQGATFEIWLPALAT